MKIEPAHGLGPAAARQRLVSLQRIARGEVNKKQTSLPQGLGFCDVQSSGCLMHTI
jgi:hypothetical protein